MTDATPLPAATPPRPLCGADMQRSLLSLQDEPDPRDEPARRGARRLLNGLAGLQLRLLAGSGGREGYDDVLATLRQELAELPEPADPRLGAIVRAISQRVQIELARRGSD